MSNVLLLLVDDVAPEVLREQLAGHADPAGRVHVVAPALVRPLDWLASADDDAQRQAEVRALEAEWTLLDTTDVEGGAGEADPVQAVEDALRSFAADEIVIAGERADPDLEAELRRFGLPVTQLSAPGPRRSRSYRSLRSLAAGRRAETPFVLFVGVNTLLFVFALLLSALIVLIVWLATGL